MFPVIIDYFHFFFYMHDLFVSVVLVLYQKKSHNLTKSIRMACWQIKSCFELQKVAVIIFSQCYCDHINVVRPHSLWSQLQWPQTKLDMPTTLSIRKCSREIKLWLIYFQNKDFPETFSHENHQDNHFWGALKQYKQEDQEDNHDVPDHISDTLSSEVAVDYNDNMSNSRGAVGYDNNLADNLLESWYYKT